MRRFSNIAPHPAQGQQNGPHLAKAVHAFAAFLLSFVLLSASVSTYADDMILSDPVANQYVGRTEAENMIANLNFADVPGTHWAKDAVTRAGALNMVKGYNRQFNPNATVSNEEAISFVVRAIGGENNAQAAAVRLQNQMPAGSPLLTQWSIGYIDVAFNLGLLTQAQYLDALNPNQSGLNPAVNFVRTAPVSRQQAADWLVRGLQTVNANAFATTATQQAIYRYNDWQNIDAPFAASMEALVSNNILNGDAGGNLLPRYSLTRAQMAQILSNMDSIYNGVMGIQKKTGTVGAVRDAQAADSGAASVARTIYVRTQDGSVDTILYMLAASTSPQALTRDVVVLRNGQVGGLPLLRQGDLIEYLVTPADNTALYVTVLSSPVNVHTVQGVLSRVDMANGQITISDANAKTFTYPMIDGIYGTETGSAPYVLMDNQKRAVSSLPVGSRVSLTLNNSVVVDIKYLGEPALVNETRGIVIENNPDFGYLTVLDNSGNQVTANYYENDIKVTKKQYYDMDDEIGGLDDLFPNFRYNPMDTVITDVEPGDIVFLRLNGDGSIASLSASTNYIAKYGQIKQFTVKNNVATMVVEYENKQTSWFEVADGIFISKEGQPIHSADVKQGDWAKILVNQAVIAPGNVIESVKELTIEGAAHYISNIVKGQLSNINTLQNQLVIQNAQTLGKTGWGTAKNLQSFNISGKDVEYYDQGKRISLDYANQYLKRSNGEVYIALENNYAGERVKKITFRDGRDEWMGADTVVRSDGNGGFQTLTSGQVSTDRGTIVRRFGRLVDGQNVMIPDYAVVSLNGGSKAAVVDITDAPDTSAVMIARGRVLSVDDGKSFTVQSMSILSGTEWVYTPIRREFTIDYNTLFLNAAGPVDDSSFISYTAGSVADKVYNIVVDGGRAARVVDSPYARRAVRGAVYGVTDGGVLIKDASYYDNTTGRWRAISNKDASMTVTLPANAIIAKNNALVGVLSLTVGDQLRVMTDVLPDKITSGISVAGYVVTVEK